MGGCRFGARQMVPNLARLGVKHCNTVVCGVGDVQESRIGIEHNVTWDVRLISNLPLHKAHHQTVIMVIPTRRVIFFEVIPIDALVVSIENPVDIIVVDVCQSD